MTSLRRSAIKSRRSFERYFNSLHLREGPTSKWPDLKKVATKLEVGAKRSFNAEKRLHASGMPKTRANALRGVPQFRHKTITNPATGEKINYIESTHISSGHNRAKRKRTKEELKLYRKFLADHPQTGGGTWYSREWKRRHLEK